MRAEDPSLIILQADNGRFIGHVLGVDETHMHFKPVARIADKSLLWDERWGGDLAKTKRHRPLIKIQEAPATSRATSTISAQRSNP